MRAPIKRALAAAGPLLLASATPALAHLNPADHGSFMSGLSHPLFGLDHILAMVAVGLWAAMIGGRAMWLVPAAFVTAMGAGFLLALTGGSLPFVEPAILASVVAFGLLVAAAVKLPIGAGMAVVAAFALFHGHAHGGEVGAATHLEYGLGFAAATVLLHLAGLGIALLVASGRLIPVRIGAAVTRILGTVTAALGVGLFAGLL
jgi:urease accessory protein